jgi:hypothetical protein
MRQRGRKSSASLSIVRAVAIDSRQRPEPPKRLSREERQVWREVTGALRPDWFYGAEHLLEIYVRALVHERFLAELVKAADPNGSRFVKLVRLKRTEAALVANLATKLRLTPRSTFDRYTPKLVSRGPRPWELGTGKRFDEDDEPRRVGFEPDEPKGSPVG